MDPTFFEREDMFFGKTSREEVVVAVKTGPELDRVGRVYVVLCLHGGNQRGERRSRRRVVPFGELGWERPFGIERSLKGSAKGRAQDMADSGRENGDCGKSVVGLRD